MSENISELVKRIARLIERYEEDIVEFPRDTLCDCADALETQAAEIERLKRELSQVPAWRSGMTKRAEAAEAEVGRLKEAICEGLNNAQDRVDYECWCDDCKSTLAPVEAILRKALDEK